MRNISMRQHPATLRTDCKDENGGMKWGKETKSKSGTFECTQNRAAHSCQHGIAKEHDCSQ